MSVRIIPVIFLNKKNTNNTIKKATYIFACFLLQLKLHFSFLSSQKRHYIIEVGTGPKKVRIMTNQKICSKNQNILLKKLHFLGLQY